jgi:hypothetical protein
MDWKARADELLEEFDMCCRARAMHNTVDVQILKDAVAKWAYQLSTQRSWGSDLEIAEACHQLEPRLKQLKEKIVLEVLHDPIRESVHKSRA